MKESGTRGSPTSMRPGARAGRGKGMNNETVERDENGRGEPPRRQGREGRIEPRMTRMISDPEIRGIREIRGKEAPSVSQTAPAETALPPAMLPTSYFLLSCLFASFVVPIFRFGTTAPRPIPSSAIHESRPAPHISTTQSHAASIAAEFVSSSIPMNWWTITANQKPARNDRFAVL